VRAIFFGLGSDGTVGANKEHDQDPRVGGRAQRAGVTSSTTRRSPARRRCHTCASGQS
jgi:hypothetical protein